MPNTSPRDPPSPASLAHHMAKARTERLLAPPQSATNIHMARRGTPVQSRLLAGFRHEQAQSQAFSVPGAPVTLRRIGTCLRGTRAIAESDRLASVRRVHCRSICAPVPVGWLAVRAAPEQALCGAKAKTLEDHPHIMPPYDPNVWSRSPTASGRWAAACSSNRRCAGRRFHARSCRRRRDAHPRGLEQCAAT